MSPVVYEVLTLTLIFALPTLGLNIISGYGGMFSVAQASLFGVGAFAYAGADRILHTDSLLLIWLIAIAAAMLLSMIVALVAMRVSGDFFIVASFGLQLVVIQIAFNWTAVSGGAPGAYGLGLPSILGHQFRTPDDFLLLSAVLAAVTYAIAGWVVTSPFGRLLRAMRDDEPALAAGGFSSSRLRSSAFVFGGVLAALGGVLYAAYQGVAQTGEFGVSVSIMLLAAVIVGGSGRLLGSALGALLFAGAPRLLNLINVSATLAGSLQQLLFGVLVVFVIAFLRGGLVEVLTAPLTLLRRRRAPDEVPAAEGNLP